MKFPRGPFAGAVLLLLGAMAAHAAAPGSINVQSDAAPRLDVIYHRAKSTNTGYVIAGLIGAAIQSGSEYDKDAGKRAALAPHLSASLWQDVFVHTLDETLRARGIEPAWATAGKKASARADIDLWLFAPAYGVRLVDSGTERVAAYVQFAAAYGTRPVNRARKADRELIYLTGNELGSIEDLLADPSGLNAELEQLLAQAARRLANKIAYNVR